MQTITVPHEYTPRPYQRRAIKAFEGGCKRMVLVWHRRCGKDLTCWSSMVIPAACERVGYYMYTYPTSKLGRRALWDGMDNGGKKFLDRIPKELISKINSTEMRVELINGSIIQVVGIDKITNVGINPVGVVFSEYSLQDPTGWDYMRPILRSNGGWCIFNFTPRGRNHAHDLYEMARGNSDWYAETLTVGDTGILSDADIGAERASGMSEELIQQEYYCSWSRGIEGSYYGRLIDAMRKDDRICRVPIESVETHVAMDLGMDDSTSMWWWQRVGQEIRIIDYYEANGEPLEHYVKVMRDKGYIYGTVWMPHDARVRELSSGVSRLETMYRLGVKAQVVPNVPLMDGIESVRQLLRGCWIDDTRCARGIECLEMYHKEYNDKMGCYCDRPLHDKWSHGADSVRYLSVAIASSGSGSASDISDLNSRYAARC